MESPDPPKRAFVLGLDGVPWSLVERWADAGELPNFERMRTEGAAGPLESTVPPVTPLAWPAIATGTWPDKHGVLGFKKFTPEYRQRMYTREDVQRPELWDLLSPAVVGNVPMTYPAARVEGSMVTGMVTPSRNERYTHPPELADTIEERIPEYQIGLQWTEYTDRPERFREELAGLVEDRRTLMRLLMEEEWRLFFFVYTAPDRLQHLLWDHETILEHYRTLDDVVGEVMEYVAARDAALFVVSDHGFGSLSKFVYLNRILEAAGHLTRRERGRRGLVERLGVSRGTVQSLLDRVGVSETVLRSHLPDAVVDGVAETLPGDHALFDVDHAQTSAFAFDSGAVYVNDADRFAEGTVDPDDVARLKKEIAALFSAVVDPETGREVLVVHDGEDLFPAADGLVPDLVVEGRDGYEYATSLNESAIVPSGTKAASHRSEGVFLAWGPSVEPGTTPESASVVDVAPTLLHCLGEPVGEAMDGRVLREILYPGPARRSVGTQAYDDPGNEPVDPGTEDFEDVEKRLRGLGYME